MNKNRLIALGPNPAWQKTLFFEELRYGEVNRASEMREIPSGKGINFCRAAGCAGRAEARLLEFVGGENGRRIVEGLDREGMTHRSIPTGNPTRSCITCLCRKTGTMTELIEPSHPVSEPEIQSFLTALDAELPEAGIVALCGTVPTGSAADFYERCARRAVAAGARLLIDSFNGIEPVLGRAAQIVLKINLEELRALTGGDTAEACFDRLFRQFPRVVFAGITDGPHIAYASDGATVVRYRLPRLDRVLNPLGSGDTASATLAGELLTGTEPIEAFRRALAAASANCLNELPGHFEPCEADSIARAIETIR